MKIEKNVDDIGSWFCTWRDKTGHYFASACSGEVGFAVHTKKLAIDRMFEKLQWAEIGNWKK